LAAINFQGLDFIVGAMLEKFAGIVKRCSASWFGCGFEMIFGVGRFIITRLEYKGRVDNGCPSKIYFKRRFQPKNQARRFEFVAAHPALDVRR
jgi:hypothetical protein